MLDNSLGEADYYDERDYVGILRRLLIYAIDFVVLLMLGVFLSIPILFLVMVGGVPIDPNVPFWSIYLLAIWIYLAPIKRTRFGTLGYLICGARIVSATGGPPSLLVMTVRMGMWVMNPFNFITDLLWIGIDPERQILRDCYLGTYVINRNATAAGRSPVHLTRYFAMGFALAYPRVCRALLREH